MIELSIKLDPETGKVHVKGPLEDKLLCYGLLCVAQMEVSKREVSEQPIIEQHESGRRIFVTANDGMGTRDAAS
jgi:hypothetical protein